MKYQNIENESQQTFTKVGEVIRTTWFICAENSSPVIIILKQKTKPVGNHRFSSRWDILLYSDDMAGVAYQMNVNVWNEFFFVL